MLLKRLKSIEGKFMLSSYPSTILKEYVDSNGWSQKKVEQTVSVANASTKNPKKKVEVMTANYDLANPREDYKLF